LKSDLNLSKDDALIIVDVQRDFCQGGALPVPEGDQVVPVLNEYMKLFKKANGKTFATRDWHPPNHISFKAQGGPWPPHCIQGSEGAQFHPDLELTDDTYMISKAMDPSKESYSGFDGTSLEAVLRDRGVRRVFVGGLATDYCVKNTVLDAIERGFETILLLDAVRGINARPDDSEKAVFGMTAKGAETAVLKDFPEPARIPSEKVPVEKIDEVSFTRAERKKKARLRSRGPYRKARIER
jgi:nicotinamidase/pyrazinamidase